MHEGSAANLQSLPVCDELLHRLALQIHIHAHLHHQHLACAQLLLLLSISALQSQPTARWHRTFLGHFHPRLADQLQIAQRGHHDLVFG